MPWSETDAMKERVRFVLEWEKRWDEGEGLVNMSELCREFGVSREAGYKWVGRYREADHNIRAVEERSRRPKTSPTALEDAMQDLIAEARKLHPKWGGRKLRPWLCDQFPGVEFPSVSAVNAVIKKRGLVSPPKRRRGRQPAAGVAAPFPACVAPNDLWCVDFKGWFRTEDGERCYPLTILDAYSRYLLRCEVLKEPDGAAVQRVFDSAFREFGVPAALRSDNGPPFASTGPGALTRLSVWWLQLGIRLERIAPGKPQQNGRHERMHRTLKLETEAAANLRAQQRAFDHWRREYNEERPHEALANRPPAEIYTGSSRTYPRKLVTPLVTSTSDASWRNICRVEKDGTILFNRRRFFVSTALKHLYVELDQVEEYQWEVKWGPIVLGKIDWRRDQRTLIVRRRRRGDVSTMSLD
jgi:transposase InsO family protein